VFESRAVNLNETTTSFYRLDPALVLAATEDAGFRPTGEFTQLNSYENRVFDIRLEKGSAEIERVIAKFYRPGRWPLQALQEEHDFLFDLKKEGIPVVAPLMQKSGKSLNTVSGMNVAFFPKFLGRMPEEFLEKDLSQVGRRLAQIHNVGSRKKFHHRAVLSEAPFSCWDNLDLLSNWVAPEVWHRYEKAAIAIIEEIEDTMDVGKFIRIHGDCHRGNLLAQLLPGNQREFSFVDFDDCAMGPPVQDFWMLFSGSEDQAEQDLILAGYEELREFPEEQWEWIPLLRGLRIFSYSAWIARRWSDPSFPKLFPNFESFTFWAEETEALEKIAWR
jgi:Ser/Thr protein kinase RdoA (MazF antagonist)